LALCGGQRGDQERYVKDVRDALMVARTSDGRLVRRPLSPHLQVYRPQITTVLSIVHRMAGVALGVGTLLLTWWLVAAATSAEAFATVQHVIGSSIGLLLLFGWTLALFFHFCNGIRHLGWDIGLGFEKTEYHATGWAVLIATCALTILVWVVGLLIW
jgi:succinate dehydrogenase / fumarate reductase cytochrome b subunit